jgi:hypothetical protein
MEKPIVSNFQILSSLLIQKYEPYLPTAFDESLSLVQKVNKVIIYLNQMGELTNAVTEQWNKVMEWFLEEGLSEAVENRFNELAESGEFVELVQDALDEMNTETNNRLNSFEASINQIVTNVKSFGAKGDGVTDDTQSVLNAIASIGVSKGLLFFPAGTYRIMSTIELPIGISIKGQGMSASIIDYRGAGACMKFPDTETNNWTWGSIQDIGFHGSPTSSVALYILNTHEGHIERVDFRNFGIGGIEFYDSYSTKITDCRFAGMTYGVKANFHANALYFKGCQFNGQSEACIIIGSGLGTAVTMCNFENAGAGVKFMDGAFLDTFTIRDSYCEYLTNGLFYVPEMNSGRIFGLVLDSNMYMGNVSSPYAVNIDTGVTGGAVRGTISNLYAFECTDSAINAIGNDVRIHVEQSYHWNYETWAEKKLFSDVTSADVTSLTRTWKALDFKGDMKVSSLTIKPSSLPVADEAYRGKVIMVQGDVGVEDKIYVCMKNSVNGFGWYQIAVPMA